jgi:hypothetical protein
LLEKRGDLADRAIFLLALYTALPYIQWGMEIIETAPFARCRDELFGDE